MPKRGYRLLAPVEAQRHARRALAMKAAAAAFLLALLAAFLMFR